MKLQEEILLEKVFAKEYKDKLVELEHNKEAIITLFLHNSKNGVSQFYKKDAVKYTKEILSQPIKKLHFLTLKEIIFWAFPSVGLSVLIFLFVPLKKDFLFNP